jgi:ABC-type transport system substrate-binding protein
MTYPTAFVINKNAVAKDPGGKITDKNTDGSGAFKLTSYTSGVGIDLAANTGYYGGSPKIAGQHRLIVTDAQTRHSLYVNGDLDIVDETAGSRDADEKDPALKDQIHYFPRASTFYLALSSNDKSSFAPFKDVRVRQAFAYATDKQRIVDVVFGGRRTVAQDILPEGIPGYDPVFKGLPYDPAKAKALLAAAGYPGGKGFPTLPISFRESYPDLAKTVDLLRQMYSENLGVTVQAQQTEWATLLNGDNAGILPAFHMRWMADYLDPQDFYSILYHTGSDENHIGYSSAQVDSLCDAADVEQDAAKRTAMYHKVAAILANDVPRIPLYYQRDIELIKPYVHGLQDSLMGHLPYKALTLGQ